MTSFILTAHQISAMQIQAQVPWGPKAGFVIEPLKQSRDARLCAAIEALQRIWRIESIAVTVNFSGAAMLNAASATKGWRSAYASEFPLAIQLQFCFKESALVAVYSGYLLCGTYLWR